MKFSDATRDALQLLLPMTPRFNIFGVKKRNGKVIWRLNFGNMTFEDEDEREIIKKIIIAKQYQLL